METQIDDNLLKLSLIWKLKDNFSYSTFSPVNVLCYVWKIVTHSHLDIESKGLWNVSVYSTIVCLANSCPRSSSFYPIFAHKYKTTQWISLRNNHAVSNFHKVILASSCSKAHVIFSFCCDSLSSLSSSMMLSNTRETVN